MTGIIGKKIGMTRLFGEEGVSQAVTVLEAGPCVVTQVKSEETDGYSAVQVGFGEIREKHVSRPSKGHFDKVGATPKKYLKRFCRCGQAARIRRRPKDSRSVRSTSGSRLNRTGVRSLSRMARDKDGGAVRQQDCSGEESGNSENRQRETSSFHKGSCSRFKEFTRGGD